MQILENLPTELRQSLIHVIGDRITERKLRIDRHLDCMETPRSRSNKAVVYNWLNNRNHSSLNMSTDGKDLFSYAMVIGNTSSLGEKVLKDRTAKHNLFVSATTSCHVGIARPYVDKIILE